MCTREAYTLDEVLDELDNSEFDDSGDDFDGYVEDEDFGWGDGSGDDGIQEDEAGGDRDREMEGSEVRCEHDETDGKGGSGGGGEGGGDDGTNEEGSVPQYCHQPGCTVAFESESPLQYFSLFFTPDMLQHIVEQTNLRAEQYISSHDLAPHSRIRLWSKGVHDIGELQRFLAMVIVMGLVRYPQIESHWSTMWPYSSSAFSSVSTCDFLGMTYGYHVM